MCPPIYSGWTTTGTASASASGSTNSNFTANSPFSTSASAYSISGVVSGSGSDWSNYNYSESAPWDGGWGIPTGSASASNGASATWSYGASGGGPATGTYQDTQDNGTVSGTLGESGTGTWSGNFNASASVQPGEDGPSWVQSSGSGNVGDNWGYGYTYNGSGSGINNYGTSWNFTSESGSGGGSGIYSDPWTLTDGAWSNSASGSASGTATNSVSYSGTSANITDNGTTTTTSTYNPSDSRFDVTSTIFSGSGSGNEGSITASWAPADGGTDVNLTELGELVPSDPMSSIPSVFVVLGVPGPDPAESTDGLQTNGGLALSPQTTAFDDPGNAIFTDPQLGALAPDVWGVTPEVPAPVAPLAGPAPLYSATTNALIWYEPSPSPTLPEVAPGTPVGGGLLGLPPSPTLPSDVPSLAPAAGPVDSLVGLAPSLTVVDDVWGMNFTAQAGQLPAAGTDWTTSYVATSPPQTPFALGNVSDDSAYFSSEKITGAHAIFGSKNVAPAFPVTDSPIVVNYGLNGVSASAITTVTTVNGQTISKGPWGTVTVITVVPTVGDYVVGNGNANNPPEKPFISRLANGEWGATFRALEFVFDAIANSQMLSSADPDPVPASAPQIVIIADSFSPRLLVPALVNPIIRGPFAIGAHVYGTAADLADGDQRRAVGRNAVFTLGALNESTPMTLLEQAETLKVNGELELLDLLPGSPPSKEFRQRLVRDGTPIRQTRSFLAEVGMLADPVSYRRAATSVPFLETIAFSMIEIPEIGTGGAVPRINFNGRRYFGVNSGAPALVRMRGSVLESKEINRLIQGLSELEPDVAAARLRKLAQQEFGLTVDVRVVDAAKWTFRRNAGFMTFIEGKQVVYLRNRPFAELLDVMRHEVTHVIQSIEYPRYFRWASSNWAPFSSIGRFRLELQAHSVQTFFSSPFHGAVVSVFAVPAQWGSGIGWLIVTGLAGRTIYYRFMSK